MGNKNIGGAILDDLKALPNGYGSRISPLGK